MKQFIFAVLFLHFISLCHQQPKMFECGMRQVDPPIVPLRDGQTYLGQWPWAVAIYHLNYDDSFEYACTGTLISSLHAITTYSCLVDANGFYTYPEKVFVQLRPNKLEATNVAQIRRREESLYAILTFGSEVRFDDYLQPACIYQHHDVTAGMFLSRRWKNGGACFFVRLGGDASDIECIDAMDCGSSGQDYEVEHVVSHEDDFKIGLIRLFKTVLFNDYIQPICLPVSDELKNMNLIEYSVISHNNSLSWSEMSINVLSYFECTKNFDGDSTMFCVDAVTDGKFYGGEPLGYPVKIDNGLRFVQFGVNIRNLMENALRLLPLTCPLPAHIHPSNCPHHHKSCKPFYPVLYVCCPSPKCIERRVGQNGPLPRTARPQVTK
ncbi:conserved hypothetical protein [Culex quinquefasciatus]|uniref:Peptidase S1 domain-containing protein n=1 Tax=Culex quinquefasciatus TaxID=7176 RepID=B0XAU8_CULQU|nr:conserved hypothetical protein [Culex quinquefasciatus]|eukprot:XP_001866770.1 conserved hypothetical protein [Culex quinquefasciatus]